MAQGPGTAQMVIEAATGSSGDRLSEKWGPLSLQQSSSFTR
jgi:hypothetical protein